MLVYRGFSRPAPLPTALTIGNFDGVHLGHRELLSRLCRIAQHKRLQPAALTFEPHPREFFTPESAPARLSTLREKLELLGEEGVAFTRVCRFDSRFASMSAGDFIEKVLVASLKTRHLIIGDDFRFGAHREGNFALLCDAGQRYGFQIERMESIRVAGERVSSSAIRSALASGDMAHAARLLGRPYSIDGRVVHGEKVGSRLGFATANIRIRHDNPPLQGVFAVEVHGLKEGAHPGVANLGIRPSVNAATRPLLEVHLLDFHANIYGAHLNVRFLQKLRDETCFADFEALKTQIAQDAESARRYFKH